MRLTLDPSLHRPAARREVHPHLADGAAGAGGAGRTHAARRRGEVLRRPHGVDPVRRAHGPRGHQRRDVHGAARVSRSHPSIASAACRWSWAASTRRSCRTKWRSTRSAVVIGEAEGLWPQVIDDFRHGRLQPIYRAHGRPIARRHGSRSHASSRASATCRWASSRRGAAVISSASSARSSRISAARRRAGRRRKWCEEIRRNAEAALLLRRRQHHLQSRRGEGALSPAHPAEDPLGEPGQHQRGPRRGAAAPAAGSAAARAC